MISEYGRWRTRWVTAIQQASFLARYQCFNVSSRRARQTGNSYITRTITSISHLHTSRRPRHVNLTGRIRGQFYTSCDHAMLCCYCSTSHFVAGRVLLLPGSNLDRSVLVFISVFSHRVCYSRTHILDVANGGCTASHETRA